VSRRAGAIANGAPVPVALVAMAIAFGIAACDRSPDKSASAKPELTPTAPAIAPPSANPAPVMPPKADAVLETPSQTAAAPPSESAEKQPPSEQTPNGGDPKAKEPMSKEEESTAMPKPAQANDHSTTATDGKQ
jgi:hypothetical protein